MATTGQSLGIALGLDAAIALIIILLFGFFRSVLASLLVFLPATTMVSQLPTGPHLVCATQGYSMDREVLPAQVVSRWLHDDLSNGAMMASSLLAPCCPGSWRAQ